MTRVKGWVQDKDSLWSFKDNSEAIYVEEIPPSAIRVEAVVKETCMIFPLLKRSESPIEKIGYINVPAALIGKKVTCIIMEVEE